MKIHLLSRLAFAVAMSVGASAHAMLVFAGGYVIPSGTTSAARPELGGSVVYDNLIPVTGTTPIYGYRISADLQTRVVRSSSDGRLSFYYRWTPRYDNQVSLTQLAIPGFSGFTTDVDYRLDGVGTFGTILARRDTDARTIRFYMPNTPSYQGSLFHFVRTNAGSYALSSAVADRIALSLYVPGRTDPVIMTLVSFVPRPWSL